MILFEDVCKIIHKTNKEISFRKTHFWQSSLPYLANTKVSHQFSQGQKGVGVIPHNSNTF